MSATPTSEVLEAWKPYLDSITNWEAVVEGIEPKQTGCGPVYELDNPIPGRPNESFAIADMRNIGITEPHYHPDGPEAETEIYIVLQGLGLIVVGGREQQIEKGSVIATPPDTTHYTVPAGELVLAVINTPSFKPENYVPIHATDPEFGFDQAQYDRLTPAA